MWAQGHTSPPPAEPASGANQRASDGVAAFAAFGSSDNSAGPQNAPGNNPFGDALQDNWLNAVGDMLGARKPDKVSMGGGAGGGGGAGSGAAAGPGPGNAGLSPAANPGAPASSGSAGSGLGGSGLNGLPGQAGQPSSPGATSPPPAGSSPGAAPVPGSPGAGTGSGPIFNSAFDPQGGATNAAQASLLTAYVNNPLAFEPNMGQSDPSVQYLSHGPGMSVFLTNGGATFVMPRTSQSPPNGQPVIEDVLGLQFTGANPAPQITAQNDLLSRSNYFTGSQALVNVPQFGTLIYHNLYPGIDLTFQGAAGRQLEYSFDVHPGASVSEIQLTWQGSQPLTLDGQGNLVLQTATRQLTQTAPSVYQAGAGGQPVAVSAQTVLSGGDQVSFQVGSYDNTKDLVIDPTLGFSSYLGGSGNDEAYAVAVDDVDGSSYVTGATASANFPTTAGAFQSTASGSANAFVTKLAPNGSIVYSSYLGTTTGGAGSVANGIAVNSAGDAYVTGTTGANFPTTPGVVQATLPAPGGAFVSELNATGSALLVSTYLPSDSTFTNWQSSYSMFDTGSTTTGIAVDVQGYAVVSGYENYSSGLADIAFAVRLNPKATAVSYANFLDSGFSSAANGVAVDSSGDAYVVGWTVDSSFPTLHALQPSLAGTQNGFVTKLSTSGSLIYSTFLGGHSTDSANAVAVDSSGDAYVTGQTTSTNFPTKNPYQASLAGTANAFVSKLSSDGTTLIYSTYLGGSGSDGGNAIAVDSGGNAVISGQTTSVNFPTANAFQSSLNGASTAAFITRLQSSGTAVYWSSYLGGGTSSTNIATGVGYDPWGDVYVDGYTSATNFPTANPAQSTNAGGYDAFISKVLPGPAPPVITGATPDSSGQTPVLTDSQNLTLSGTSPASATVTLYRADLGTAPIGTVTANGSGAWSYNYGATTTLAADTYSFTATDTVGGVVSNSSLPFAVTVELTGPTVTVVAPTPTTSFAPQVIVQADDLNPLPDGTTVTLKVDLLQNGTYTGSATGTLDGGYATITSPAVSAAGTYNMKAQVTDPAGNTGTSPVVAVTVNAATSATLTAWSALSDPLAGDSLSQMGNLQLSEPLTLDTSGGSDPASTDLVYNSAEVSVKPTVQATLQTVNNAALPTTVSAALTWNGTLGATYTYNTTGATKGDLLTLAIQEPTTVTSTGAYPWSLTVVENYGTPVTLTQSGTAYVVTEDGSAFGAGWSLGGVNQIVSVSGGVMMVYGSGFAQFWAGTTSFTAPKGDNGTLTLSGSVYTYTTPTDEQTKFNSNGYETSWTSGDGLSSITYGYNGSNQLTQITAVDGTLSTITYSSGLAQTIQTSNSRTTSLAYDGSSNLTQVTNPDSSTPTFTYDSGHHATGETFGNTQNEWAYSSGALATITTGNSTSPTAEQLAPAMLKGLETGSTGNVFNDGDVYATKTDPALGTSTFMYATKTVLDGQGRTTKVVAANGGITQYALNSNGWVTAVTDPMGRTTSYALDSDGYTTQTTNPDGTTNSTQYQSGAFHLPTAVTDENGHTTSYTYDTLGHELTMKDALGNVTSYAYDPTTGLQTTVTDALNHTTSYAYDSKRRLTKVTDALGDVTSYTYDNNGNQQTTVDALGHTSTTLNDVMGRTTTTIDALGDTATMAYLTNGLAGRARTPTAT